MFPKPSHERPALSISPTPSCSTFMRKVRQLRTSPSQELEAFRGKPTAVAAFTSETLRSNKTHNLCWFAFLNITAERQVHYPVAADQSTQGTMMFCDSTTCFLSLKSQTPQRSCPWLFSRASWRVQEPSACSVPIGTRSPRMSDKNPKELKKSPRKHLQEEIFLVSLSKTYSSSVLLKCVYSIAR